MRLSGEPSLDLCTGRVAVAVPHAQNCTDQAVLRQRRWHLVLQQQLPRQRIEGNLGASMCFFGRSVSRGSDRRRSQAPENCRTHGPWCWLCKATACSLRAQHTCGESIRLAELLLRCQPGIHATRAIARWPGGRCRISLTIGGLCPVRRWRFKASSRSACRGGELQRNAAHLHVNSKQHQLQAWQHHVRNAAQQRYFQEAARGPSASTHFSGFH